MTESTSSRSVLEVVLSCDELLLAAGRELRAFMAAIHLQYGAEVAKVAGDCWVTNLEMASWAPGDHEQVWRCITIATLHGMAASLFRAKSDMSHALEDR